jgi:hypothetical protein
VRASGIEDGERVRQVRGDLTGPDDHQVEVWHQGERAAALTGAVVQDDRAGLGDRGRAAGHHPRHPVEFGRGQRRLVGGQLDSGWHRGQPLPGEPGRHREGARRGGGPGGQHPGDGGGEIGPGRYALHHGTVVRGAFGEQVHDVTAVMRAQVIPGQRRVRRVDTGRAARGTRRGADPRQHLVPRTTSVSRSPPGRL